ncbi:unnamed protein product [Cuscuta epithymum]|uniref:Uncharacterized protein n=1 Tax=Cuscuta epithymum TaxID=186058 RepID=A0AAV0FPD9_9ASTE|nr:unnamed protein product [Cuscuta epithymum]
MQKFYILDLGGTDVMLGMEWLTGLGDMEVNFQNQTLKWRKQEQNYIIQGDTALNQMDVPLKTVTNILQNTGDGYLQYCEGIEQEQKHITTQDETGNRMVEEFPEVFK